MKHYTIEVITSFLAYSQTTRRPSTFAIVKRGPGLKVTNMIGPSNFFSTI